MSELNSQLNIENFSNTPKKFTMDYSSSININKNNKTAIIKITEKANEDIRQIEKIILDLKEQSIKNSLYELGWINLNQTDFEVIAKMLKHFSKESLVKELQRRKGLELYESRKRVRG